MPTFPTRLTRTLIVSSLLLALTAVAGAQQGQLPQRFTAFAVNLGADRPAARANVVEINIERWSTEAERTSLLDTFRKQGESALLRALQDTERVGYIRTPDSIGWDLRFAYQEPTSDGGRRIVIATDRRIGFWEVYNNTQSTDYPFTLIELRLGSNGEGEGRMSLATRVGLSENGKILQLENYSAQPVLLRNVQQKN
jgi:hypothetical protein